MIFQCSLRTQKHLFYRPETVLNAWGITGHKTKHHCHHGDYMVRMKRKRKMEDDDDDAGDDSEDGLKCTGGHKVNPHVPISLS